MEKSLKKEIIWVSVILLPLLFIFPSTQVYAQKKMISIGGGPAGGAMAMAAAGMSDYISKHIPSVDASARGTGASEENYKLLGLKGIEFGMSASDIAYKAQNTLPPFKNVIKNVRGVGLIWMSDWFMMVKKDSGIISFKDLNGKKIAGGAAGTGMLSGSRQILPLFGVKLDDVKSLGYGPAAYAFQDGRIDAMAMRGPLPFPPAMELATTQDVRFLSMTDSEQKTVIAKYPYYCKNTIRPGVYRLQDYPIQVVSQDCYLATRDDISEVLVYQVAKLLFSEEGLKYLSKVHRIFATLEIDKLLEWAKTTTIVQMHPGAMRYYQEVAKQLGK